MSEQVECVAIKWAAFPYDDQTEPVVCVSVPGWRGAIERCPGEVYPAPPGPHARYTMNQRDGVWIVPRSWVSFP